MCETRKCGNCDALQLEAEPVIFRFDWDARAKFEVGEPISSYLKTFLLLMRYFTL